MILRPLVPIGLALAVGVLTVWQRAAIVHAGAELSALRAQEARLAEESLALRMGLARATSPRRLSTEGGEGEPWDATGGRTHEVIAHARASRQALAGASRPR